MLSIVGIQPGSPASFAGILPNDSIVSCCGCKVDDWLDFAQLAVGSDISIVIRRSSIERVIRLRRRPGIQWGLHFEGEEPAVCRSKCIFCFVDQLPSDARASLKVRDDDVRYSFYQGTYVTLSMKQAEYAVEKKLSPIHVSIHTTNPVLRGEIMMGGHPLPILPQLKLLSGAGIKMEAQIVVIPGWNDACELEQTISDLFSIEGITQLGVVPLGLTKHREGLTKLVNPSKSEAEDVLNTCEKWRDKALEIKETGWIYPADEFFCIAGKKVPPPEFYIDCTLRANGIGLLSDLPDYDTSRLTGSGILYCGMMAEPFLSRILENTEYRIVPVENMYLGEMVTVSGLMAGQDVARTIKMGNNSIARKILPEIMFNREGTAIDGWTAEDIERDTGCSLTVIADLNELY